MGLYHSVTPCQVKNGLNVKPSNSCATGKNPILAPTAICTTDFFKWNSTTILDSERYSTLAQKVKSLTKLLLDAKWQGVLLFVRTITASAPGTVCVDLDSVLLHHETDWPISRLGHPLRLGRELTRLLKSKGFRVVVLTSRIGLYNHGMIHEKLRAAGFQIDHVTNRKPPAIAYFDDRAFRIPKNWK